jgi:Arc/MetJ-type ribon-helix-helix transcriptional regulator
MSEVVPVRLKGKLKDIVDDLVNRGIFGSKSEVIRAGVRKIGEEYGLISTGGRYHLRELQLMAREGPPEETMDKLEKISDEIWRRRKKLYE